MKQINKGNGKSIYSQTYNERAEPRARVQLFLPSPEAEVVGQSNSLNLRRVRSLQGEARHEQWLNWSRCSGLLKEFHQGNWHLLTGWPSMTSWEREGPEKISREGEQLSLQEGFATPVGHSSPSSVAGRATTLSPMQL